MKVSCDWLSEFISPLPPAARMGDALTMGGLPVEHIDEVVHESLPGVSDTVLDVEVTSNRVDCLSVMGVAREIAGLMKLDFHATSKSKSIRIGSTPGVSVRIDAAELCPHYTARTIAGIRVGPSPEWMQRRLRALGQRPINNVVDITNYVLFEMGQPLHAFDARQVRGSSIIVRRASAGEMLTTLDGVERKLDPSMLVIADAERPQVVAGIMGGMDSGVSEATTDLILESARFDMLSVRRTSRALGLASDSSYRFERGLDPTLVERASDRAAELLVELAGAREVGPMVAAGASGYTPASVKMRLARLQSLLGVDWPMDRCVSALLRLGFDVHPAQDVVRVSVPSHRLDVRIEADVIEEVARVVGYEHIPTRDEVPIRLQERDERRVAIDLIRRTLQAAGHFEALTLSFVSDALADAFTPVEAKSLHQVDPRTRRADNRLRPSVIPGLLESIRLNESNGTTDAKLYEIASTFWIASDGSSCERRTVALVGSDDYSNLRGTIETLLGTLDAQRAVKIVPAKRSGFSAVACGEIFWGDESIGFAGRVDRKAAEQIGLRGTPATAELWLDALVAGTRHVPQQTQLPRFPAIERDVSLVLPESIRFSEIELLVQELKLPNLEQLGHTATFRGKSVGSGQKSVTISLRFRSDQTTLTGESVDAHVKSIIGAAQAKLGATLRG